MRDFPLKNLAYPVLLVTSIDGERWEPGSGFYFEHQDSLYLVTAKHVLEESNAEIVRYVRVISYAKDPNVSERFDHIIDLQEFRTSGFLLLHKHRDVAAIKLRIKRIDGLWHWILPVVREISNVQPNISSPVHIGSSSVRKYSDIYVGNEVYVYGFPISIGLDVKDAFFNPERPLLKKGVVAGLYRSPLDSEAYGTVILDCMVHRGNSGSPAIQVELIGLVEIQHPETQQKGITIQYKHHLIGIVTHFIPYQLDLYGEQEKSSRFKGLGNSGYAGVEPIDTVFELLS